MKFSILITAIVFSVLLVGGFSNVYAAGTVNVVENKVVQLLGSGIDPDGNDLSFKWVQTYGEPVTLSSYNIPEPTFMAPEIQNGEIKVLIFELTVTDPQGATSSDEVEIIVNPVNHPPSVDAGNDRLALPSVNAMTITPSASDPDGDELFFEWKQLSGQPITISNPFQKHLTFQPIYLDYSTFEPLVFEITVDDHFGGIASDTVRVYPYLGVDENRRISIDAGPMQTVKQGELVTLTVTGQTLDNAPIRYTWVQLIGEPVKLDSFVGDVVTFVAPEIGDNEELLSFQVSGYSQGNGWATDLALVKVIPGNAPPVADAGMDQNVQENQLVKIIGTGSDPDGDPINYSWRQVSGPAVELYERASFSNYFFSPYINNQSEELIFELTVRDNYGNSDTDQVSIFVLKSNHPPTANAGPDMRVKTGSQVTVTGTGSDPNGDELTYSWRQVSGQSVDFDKTNPTFNFIAPEVANGEIKRMVFELSVSDGVYRDFDQMVVIVVPENSPPIVDAGNDVSVPENSQVDIMCTGIDPDGDVLQFTWTSSNSAIPTTMTPMMSIMTPSVVSDIQIIMTCTVSDGRLSASDSMTITVRNTLNLPIVADAGDDRIVNEKVRVSLDGTNSHDPENQPLQYSWKQLSGEKVTLSSATSITPSFISPTVANNEIKVLTFELLVYDNNGRSDTDTVTITVDPVNAPPEATATAEQLE